MKLGTLKQVNLREIWKHEAINFTNWLAKPENLDLLSEEINIELSLIETEYNVGRFNVDIYAEEGSTSRKVIIENQLERTDHDHLGKLITYASGLDAEIIIWIVKEVLEEHEQAILWLNDNTDEKINFFAIRMEVWQIGDSASAPKFHIVAKPNNWSKAVKKSSQSQELSPTKKLQLEFWETFKEYATANGFNLRLRKASPQHWYSVAIGRSDCYIELTINSQKKELACEIYIPDSLETYQNFLNNKLQIESEVGSLDWMELPEKKASRIKNVRKGDFTKRVKWTEFFQWIAETAVSMQDTFNKY